MEPPYPAEYPVQPYAARKPRKKMRTSSIVILVIVLLLAAGGGVAAYLLLKGESKTSFKLGDGSVTGVKIEFHDLTLSQTGNNLTLTGTYDNKSKSKGSVYVTVQAISKTNEQSMTFTVPVVAGNGKRFTQKKTSNIKLESAALGSLFFQGTESLEENTDSSATNSGTLPWGDQSSSITPTPESSSTTNDSSIDNQTLPGSETAVPGAETPLLTPETGNSTP
jgi:flagellar basal body-associated protein FliL